MNARDTRLVAIGNSKGIRISKALREKYGWSGSVVLDETEDGILLRRDARRRLSWKETYQAMAHADEDWSDLEVSVADGLDSGARAGTRRLRWTRSARSARSGWRTESTAWRRPSRRGSGG